MFKILLVLLALAGPAAAQAQTAPEPHLELQEGEYRYSAVVPIEGATKDELYQRANRWVMQTFVSSKQVIELADPAAGTLAGTGIVTTNFVGRKASFPTRFLFTIDVKEGRYRLVTSHFMLAPGTAYEMSLESHPFKKVQASVIEALDLKMKDLDAGLRRAMTTPAVSADF